MTKQKRVVQHGRLDEDGFAEVFLAGDYPECRRLLSDAPLCERTVLLRAMIDFREQRYVEMIEPLISLKPSDPRTANERDALLGVAYGHTKDYSTARMRLDRVLERTREDDPLHSDALFYKGLVAWIEHEHRESETLCEQLLRSTSSIDRVRAHILLSWIALRRRELEDQASELIEALDILAQMPHPDEYYRARALMALTLICRELPLGKHVDRIRDTYAGMKWTPGIKLAGFQVTRMLGWIDALQGDELSAFRAFRNATAMAPSEYWRVLCITDRAYLARNTGQISFAEDLMHEAHEIAGKLSWHETPREERSALFVLAELFAPTAPSLSQQYLAQYRSLNTSVMPGIAYTDDPRIRAHAEYSSGVALLELGERGEATPMLLDAREIFEAYHYGWRAALCALALHKTTSDEKWLVDARRHIAPWPRSWIAREVAAAADAASSKHLSKAQRKVLDLLVEGKSNVEIAKALGRSPYTVRNHIAQLFRTYNVTNRTRLAALFKHH